jgi:hypothetical protein
MRPLAGYFRQTIRQFPGGIKVGKPLGEVNRIILKGNSGHPPDNRIGKIPCSFAKTLHNTPVYDFNAFPKLQFLGKPP